MERVKCEASVLVLSLLISYTEQVASEELQEYGKDQRRMVVFLRWVILEVGQ